MSNKKRCMAYGVFHAITPETPTKPAAAAHLSKIGLEYRERRKETQPLFFQGKTGFLGFGGAQAAIP